MHACALCWTGEVSGVSGLWIESLSSLVTAAAPVDVMLLGGDKDAVSNCSHCSLHCGVNCWILDAGVPLVLPTIGTPSVGLRTPQGLPTLAVLPCCSSWQGRGTPAAPVPAGVERLCKWVGTTGWTEGAKEESCSRLRSALQGASEWGPRPGLQMLQ